MHDCISESDFMRLEHSLLSGLQSLQSSVARMHTKCSDSQSPSSAHAHAPAVGLTAVAPPPQPPQPPYPAHFKVVLNMTGGDLTLYWTFTAEYQSGPTPGKPGTYTDSKTGTVANVSIKISPNHDFDITGGGLPQHGVVLYAPDALESQWDFWSYAAGGEGGPASGTATLLCEETANCTDGHACSEGTCVPSCTKTNHCTDGHACLNGACVPSCTKTSDCTAGHYCLNGACAPGCGTDSDCTAGHYCLKGACAPGCGADSDCTAGHYCLKGACAPGCGADSDLPDWSDVRQRKLRTELY